VDIKLLSLLGRLGSVFHLPLFPFKRVWHMLVEVQNRERVRLVSEFAQTKGLMPLLMKQRNGYRWTAEDKRMIRENIAALLHMGSYLILFAAPGGSIIMPILAWWLDRRRIKRQNQPAAPGAPSIG